MYSFSLTLFLFYFKIKTWKLLLLLNYWDVHPQIQAHLPFMELCNNNFQLNILVTFWIEFKNIFVILSTLVIK